MRRHSVVYLLLATSVATGAFAQSQPNNFGSSAFNNQQSAFANQKSAFSGQGSAFDKERGLAPVASSNPAPTPAAAPVPPSARAVEAAAPSAQATAAASLDAKAQERIAETAKNYVPKQLGAADIMPGASPSAQVLSGDSELSALDTSAAREARSHQGMATAPNNPYELPSIPDAASTGRN